MNVERYLKRIKFNGPLKASVATLKALHRQHILNVPFENLDVHYKRLFDLKPANVYDKVVNRKRGGFCYEVNSLFNDLLKSAGFKTKIISGRVITDAAQPGPEYDHMAIIININKKEYMADVGFGDLFVEPIEVREGIQFDGRNYFKIENEGPEMCLLMSSDGQHFARKYTFTLTEIPISLFEGPCHDKQINPDSHFVKNTICTILSGSGRITVYNDKFTETIGDQKIQIVIQDAEELTSILRTRFGIEVR